MKMFGSNDDDDYTPTHLTPSEIQKLKRVIKQQEQKNDEEDFSMTAHFVHDD